MRYFILIKRKGAKAWLGAIPARSGVSLAKLRSVVRKNLKKGFIARIVTDSAMRSLLKRAGGRRGAGRPTRRPRRARRTVGRRRRRRVVRRRGRRTTRRRRSRRRKR